MKKLYRCFIFLVPLGTTAQVPTRIFKASQIAEKGVFSTEKVKAKKELNVDLTQVLRDDEKEKGSGALQVWESGRCQLQPGQLRRMA